MKIAVLVSGGVDSSVALKLLKEAGHHITAFYLKIWLEDELSFLGKCPWDDDLRYVRSLCEQEEVPLQILSLQKEYYDEVVGYTLDEVSAGRTPNPDILCNQRIKFGLAVKQIGPSFDKIATGHYAKIEEHDGMAVLSKTPDAIKDQTYFLSYLRQEQLRSILLPLGALTKADVRTYAAQQKLPTADRKDSQGICFLGKIKFSDFIRYHLGDRSGELVEFETGLVVGLHKGFYYYTIGQRQGIGLSGGPWYVVQKDSDANRVYVSRNYYEQDKRRDTFRVERCNWISGKAPIDGEIIVKLRHGPDDHSAHIVTVGDHSAHVRLIRQDQGIAPGQFAVFYQNNICLGAGVISTD